MQRTTNDNRYRRLESRIRLGTTLQPAESLKARLIAVMVNLRRRNTARQWHTVEDYPVLYVLG